MMNRILFSGRVGIQQRVLAAYRIPFFDQLAGMCSGGLSVFAGEPLPRENIRAANNLLVARYEPADNTHFSHPGSVFYRCWQVNIQNWLAKWSPDVLIIEANPRYPSNLGAIEWMHKRDRAVVGWGLGAPPIEGILGSVRQQYRWRLLDKLDAIIAYSTLGRDQYRAIGYPEQRIFVATNAAFPSPTSPVPERSVKPPTAVNLLFVGRLQRRKRIDLLLHACAGLPPELQPNLWIVGEGPIMPELESLAQRIFPRAMFFGALFGSELDSYFEHADLFVLPGTGGLAIQQAMTFGLPVVAAQGDGTQADLVRNSNGWLIPPGDLGALISALSEALSDPVDLHQKGEESYRIVKAEVNLDTMVSQFLEALEAVTS